MADITTKMAEALRLAHDHIEMDKLLVSHPRDWALIKDALAYEAEAKPAPAPLTNADVVEAWRTTEARRDDYGWTSCEWFQEGVRFAQRHYRVGAAAPAALAALEAEAKPAPAEPVARLLQRLLPLLEAAASGSVVSMAAGDLLRDLRAMLAAAPAAPAEVSGHAEFALQALVAAGHISQATVDGALQIAKRVVPAPAAPAPHPDTKDAERLDWLVNGDGDGPSLILWDQDYKGQPFTTLRACGSINVTGRFDNVRDAIDAAMRGEQGENQP